MKYLAVLAFLAGLLLAVRVMFFGVQRVVGEDRLHHRRWPLALASFLIIAGALLYSRWQRDATISAGWIGSVLVIGLAAGAGAWWVVKRSAAVPSTDPDDDPRFRFQGHVARVVEPIVGIEGSEQGRIVLQFDGREYAFLARWSTTGEGAAAHRELGGAGAEVVIEIVENDVAYVEPWAVVEERL